MSVDVENDGLEVVETREWLDSMDYILRHRGRERALSLLERLEIHVKQSGIKLPFIATTPYINTIPVDQQPPFPGSQELERRKRSALWEAQAALSPWTLCRSLELRLRRLLQSSGDLRVDK